jgi:hypothetical protein
VKTDSPDPADFATTQHLICRLWHFTLWLGGPLAYRAVTSAICKRSAQGALPDMPILAGFFCASRDMPTVAQTNARSAKNRQWIRCPVVAKSAGSENPVLTSMSALLYGP